MSHKVSWFVVLALLAALAFVAYSIAKITTSPATSQELSELEEVQ